MQERSRLGATSPGAGRKERWARQEKEETDARVVLEHERNEREGPLILKYPLFFFSRTSLSTWVVVQRTRR